MSEEQKKSRTIEEALGNRANEPVAPPTEDEIIAQSLSQASAEELHQDQYEELPERDKTPPEPEEKFPDAEPENPEALLRNVEKETQANEDMGLYEDPTELTMESSDNVIHLEEGKETPGIEKVPTKQGVDIPVANLGGKVETSQDPRINPEVRPTFSEVGFELTTNQPPQEVVHPNTESGNLPMETTTLSQDIKNPPATQPSTQESEGVKDKDLENLKEYVYGNEFNRRTVELTITTLSSIPRSLPFPSLWRIPKTLDISKFVYNILMTPGYLDGIWESLAIVMSDNKANTYWTASVAIGIALYDSLKFLPIAQMKPEDF